MPRKVMCGKDTMKAVGTVTKKLATWLAEKGYIEDATEAQEQAQAAQRFARLPGGAGLARCVRGCPCARRLPR